VLYLGCSQITLRSLRVKTTCQPVAYRNQINDWLSRNQIRCTAWHHSAVEIGQHSDSLLVPYNSNHYNLAVKWLGTPCLTYQQQWGFTGMTHAVYIQAANSPAVQTHYHAQSDCYERALGAMIRSDVAPVVGAPPAAAAGLPAPFGDWYQLQ
jgi:hypothetical protein